MSQINLSEKYSSNSGKQIEERIKRYQNEMEHPNENDNKTYKTRRKIVIIMKMFLDNRTSINIIKLFGDIFSDKFNFLCWIWVWKKGKGLKPIYLMIDLIIVKFGPFNSYSYTIHSIILEKKLLIIFFLISYWHLSPTKNKKVILYCELQLKHTYTHILYIYIFKNIF